MEIEESKPTPSTLTFLTCNLNGDLPIASQPENRLNLFLGQLSSTSSQIPHIIAFQEITEPLLEIIQAKLSTHYHIFSFAHLALLINQQIAFKEPVNMPFPITSQRNGCLGIQIKSPGPRNVPFWIWTGKFETGLGADEIRRDQYLYWKKNCESLGEINSIWLGDFGIISDDDHTITEPLENLLIADKWTDSWRQMRCPQHAKYTFNPKSNQLANYLSASKRPHRPDRIICLTPQYKALVTYFSLWGSGLTTIPFPSAHYAVLSTISLF